MLTAVRSEKGNYRENNEDFIATTKFNGYKLYVIADGMGGENKGEVASKIAVETLCEVIERELNSVSACTDDQLKDLFTNAFQKANRNILQYCADNGLRDSDMGTTLTAVLNKDRKLYVAHLGDSRAYLKHGSSLIRITTDHVAPNNSNELVKCLGINSFIYPDFYSYNIMYGDLIMLCTDGVHGKLSDKDIVECIKIHNDLEGSLDKLFNRAYEAGSQDNVSCILANIRPE